MAQPLSAWLRLREPADTTARSTAITQAVVEGLPASETTHVLDLATGTGSNIRYLAPRLAGRQRWLVVDRDPVSLSLLPELISSWADRCGYEVVSAGTKTVVVKGETFECHVETRSMDLCFLCELDIFAGCHLVTASALLDLVSETWLEALARRCRDVGAAALFALTYNGTSWCTPAEAEDEMIRDFLNRHQRTDKGLGGAAAGPDACDAAARSFQAAGYRVSTEASDWTLGADEAELQRCLIDGWAEAAIELEPERESGIADWHARRLAHVDAGGSHIGVGHFDLAACLPRRTA